VSRGLLQGRVRAGDLHGTLPLVTEDGAEQDPTLLASGQGSF
jgi:hypothetical protein